MGWGSTYNTIKEALEIIGNKQTAFLHFSQVYPLHPLAWDYIKQAQKLIAVENNQTGQFADFVKQKTGMSACRKILKYSGMPFSVEELVEKLKKELV